MLTKGKVIQGIHELFANFSEESIICLNAIWYPGLDLRTEKEELFFPSGKTRCNLNKVGVYLVIMY